MAPPADSLTACGFRRRFDPRSAGGVEVVMEDGRTLIALTGCPNTGKTTIFNGLTGRRTPTGNWAGTTVEPAVGAYRYSGQNYLLADIPGTDSLTAGKEWETLTRDFLRSGMADGILVVCSASALERGLSYLDRILRLDCVRGSCVPVVLCLNLWDEAKKREITIDLDLLSDVLQIPVVPCCAHDPEDLDDLKAALHHANHSVPRSRFLYECLDFSPKRLARACRGRRAALPLSELRLNRLAANPVCGALFLFLVMTALCWITTVVSAPVTGVIQGGAARLSAPAGDFFSRLPLPVWLKNCLLTGIFRPLVLAVPALLPPMAVFFPLLALLAESGILPRAAFAMDRCLHRCRACGRQCMCMAVGLGCSASSVLSSRAIFSPRERMVAIMTSSLIPCSGKFPLLAALLPLFFMTSPRSMALSGLGRALLLSAAFALALSANLGLSYLLTHTMLKGGSSSFPLELPSFRRPRIRTVVSRSLFDRVILVLGRMAAVTAPAGLALWIAAHIFFTCPASGPGCLFFPADAPRLSLLALVTHLLTPLGMLMGLDGAILCGFLIGFPANEAVLPAIVAVYLLESAPPSSSLFQLLSAHGWTWKTALCLMVFCLFHWPCLTTCRMIRQETRSPFWTAAAVLMPTALGIGLCAGLNALLTLLF